MWQDPLRAVNRQPEFVGALRVAYTLLVRDLTAASVMFLCSERNDVKFSSLLFAMPAE